MPALLLRITDERAFHPNFRISFMVLLVSICVLMHGFGPRNHDLITMPMSPFDYVNTHWEFFKNKSPLLMLPYKGSACFSCNAVMINAKYAPLRTHFHLKPV